MDFIRVQLYIMFPFFVFTFGKTFFIVVFWWINCFFFFCFILFLFCFAKKMENLKMVVKIEMYVVFALLNPFEDTKSQGYIA